MNITKIQVLTFFKAFQSISKKKFRLPIRINRACAIILAIKNRKSKIKNALVPLWHLKAESDDKPLSICNLQPVACNHAGSNLR
jgi:hypothetical protein